MTQYIKKFNKTQKNTIKPKKAHKTPKKKKTRGLGFFNKPRVFASPGMRVTSFHACRQVALYYHNCEIS